MEEARQHSFVDSRHFTLALVALWLGGLIACLAVILSALMDGGSSIFPAVRIFAVLTSLRIALILIRDGIKRTANFTQKRLVREADNPWAFWSLMTLNAVLLLFFMALTQIPFWVE